MEDDYPCVVDGAPASIGVNLRFEHAPPATHDTRYTLAILMRDGGDRGIGTEAEAAALDLVEEALMRQHRRAFGIVRHLSPPGHRQDQRQDQRQGSTMILVCTSGLARSAKAFATPSMPTLAVTMEAASTCPSAIRRKE